MFNLPLLFLQVAVILAAARSVGWIFRKMHHPQVVGEMVAGILLGPSLLGLAAPGMFNFLFPPQSLGFLNALSQIGLVLFMFLVGLELDAHVLKNQRRVALFTSHVSIVFPFMLGTLLALYLYPRLANNSVTFIQFALFIGTAMSITAFPVLARILTERKLLRTTLGAVTIACAAVDDVTGWIILAIVVLLIRTSGGFVSTLLTIGGVALYILVMWFLVRRLLFRLETKFEQRGALSQDTLAIILLLVLASSLVTERLGIHALFGAFLMGVIMPKHPAFVHAVTEKLNDVAVVLLLPIFFAFNGLRTSIGSMTISEGTDGRVLVLCFSHQSSIDEITGAVGLEVKDLMPDNVGFQRAKPLRMKVNPRDALYAVRDDMAEALVYMKRLQRNETISMDDSLRFSRIVGRLQMAIELTGDY